MFVIIGCNIIFASVMAKKLTQIDESRHYLGSMCKRNHDWNGSGKSARFKHNNLCIECKRENHSVRKKADEEYAARKRETNRKAAEKRSSSIDGRKKVVEAQLRYRKRMLAENDNFALVERIRGRVRRAFSYYSNRGKYLKSREFGIDYKAIIEHIGPCPGNREDYHVDHVIPLNHFDFSDPEQIRKAFAPENHQWLLANDNLKKGCKMPIESRIRTK